jgi:anti-anti-sigma factor
MSDQSFDVLVVDHVYTVRCEGALRADEAPRLREQVKPLFPNARKVTLDLSQVTQMDSIGLGTIASLYVSARTARCEFEVVNLTHHVRELFRMTRLLTLFEAAGECDARIP